jgi:hypothetical protein
MTATTGTVASGARCEPSDAGKHAQWVHLRANGVNVPGGCLLTGLWRSEGPMSRNAALSCLAE